MASISVPIHFPHQPLIVLRGVQVIDDGGVIHGNCRNVGRVRVQDCSGPLGTGRSIPLQLPKQRRVPNDGVPAALAERGHDRRRSLSPPGLDQALDGRDADVGQIYGPDEGGRGAEGTQGSQRSPERGDGPAVHVEILDNKAIVSGEDGADSVGIGADDRDAGLQVQRLEGFENAHYKGSPAEVEQGFRSAHPGRAPGREDDAG